MNKLYFSNYLSYNDITIPGKITEINYISDTDSVVSRITYSNLKVGADATGEFFDFKIPEDAKIVQ